MYGGVRRWPNSCASEKNGSIKMKPKTVTKLIGKFGVDSGSVMICDPCYFNDVGRFEPKKLEQLAKEHDERSEHKMAENCRRLAKNKGEMQMITSDWDSFCETYKGEPTEFGDGVIFPSGYGDGQYEVYASFNEDGRVSKIEVVFID